MTNPYVADQRPDFVIVGVPCEAGVMLMASTELNEVELRAESDYDRYADDFGMLRYTNPRHRYYLTTQMRGYVVVVAPTYPEAFARLFGQWSPSDNPQDVLDAVVRAVQPTRLRAIEGGRS